MIAHNSVPGGAYFLCALLIAQQRHQATVGDADVLLPAEQRRELEEARGELKTFRSEKAAWSKAEKSMLLQMEKCGPLLQVPCCGLQCSLGLGKHCRPELAIIWVKEHHPAVQIVSLTDWLQDSTVTAVIAMLPS